MVEVPHVNSYIRPLMIKKKNNHLNNKNNNQNNNKNKNNSENSHHFYQFLF